MVHTTGMFLQIKNILALRNVWQKPYMIIASVEDVVAQWLVSRTWDPKVES